MKVEYSPIALRDLDHVWNEVYNTAKDATLSEKYIEGIMDAIAAKKEFPKSGAPLYYESGFAGFYSVLFKSYLVFYQVKTDHLFVVRVLYARSDYMRTLFGKSVE